jgi:hypothetical protein
MIARLTSAALLAAAANAPADADGRARALPAAPLISEFAACAARRWQSVARDLMATRIGSRAEQRLARRLVQGRGDCVRRRVLSLQMQAGAIRGAVAEELIESDPEAMARLRAMPSRPPVRAQDQEDDRAFVAGYARCIADSEPARASRLLDVPVEAPTADQQAAYDAFGDLLNDCTPLGKTYALNPIDLRRHIASELYSLAHPAATAAR